MHEAIDAQARRLARRGRRLGADETLGFLITHDQRAAHLTIPQRNLNDTSRYLNDSSVMLCAQAQRFLNLLKFDWRVGG